MKKISWRLWRLRISFWFRHNRATLALVACSVLAYYVPHYLFSHGHRPPVGVYVAVMGLVIAIMAIHTEPGKIEKFLWIIFATMLMVAEIQNLYKASDEQNKTFSKINGSLDKTEQGLDKTAGGISATAGELNTDEANNQKKFREMMYQLLTMREQNAQRERDTQELYEAVLTGQGPLEIKFLAMVGDVEHFIQVRDENKLTKFGTTREELINSEAARLAYEDETDRLFMGRYCEQIETLQREYADLGFRLNGSDPCLNTVKRQEHPFPSSNEIESFMNQLRREAQSLR
jgi:hypothetical protein